MRSGMETARCIFKTESTSLGIDKARNNEKLIVWILFLFKSDINLAMRLTPLLLHFLFQSVLHLLSPPSLQIKNSFLSLE